MSIQDSPSDSEDSERAWVASPPPESAEGPLRELYDRVRDPRNGQLDAIMQVHGQHPAGLSAHFELYRAVMRPSAGLPARLRETVALVVSGLNSCEY